MGSVLGRRSGGAIASRHYGHFTALGICCGGWLGPKKWLLTRYRRIARGRDCRDSDFPEWSFGRSWLVGD